MITTDPAQFVQRFKCLSAEAALPGSVFMVRPDRFEVSGETAQDNHYMNLASQADSSLAARQFDGLTALLRDCGIAVRVFAGKAKTPDDVFPNNVFATAPGSLVIGRMCYPGRQREADRKDIPQWLLGQGRQLHDLRGIDGVAELTGSLIIDRARQAGFCGLSERADEAGAAAMHEAFGLDLSLVFELAKGEYHTNVIMSVLAGRVAVVQPESFADAAVPQAISECYEGRVLCLTREEKQAFAGNCIALTENDLFMSQCAADSLRSGSRSKLESWGFCIRSVDLSEIEKAGGSLRCMVAEVF